MSGILNVIALISGGKDSLYSILHCLENGHKVVALANLRPKPQVSTNGGEKATSNGGDEDKSEDLNSFMYQTVGHSIIPLYEECLGIPLFRREITGLAIQTGTCYDAGDLSSSQDETEDLIPLLKEVLQTHPEANALCSGAILSTYQRTRVESVAVRLGLIPLAYLWQYPALPPPVGRGESLTGLLDDMAAAGCDARIIKIASGGIEDSLLWANVADPKMQLRLVTGLSPFFSEHEFWLRGAVLGEGGEYETLAINGPRRLWKKRIEVPLNQQSAFTEEGGVSYLRMANPRTVPNEADVSGGTPKSLRIPQSFDPSFQAVSTIVQSLTIENAASNIRHFDAARDLRPRPLWTTYFQNVVNFGPDHVSISNLTSAGSNNENNSHTAATQIKEIVACLNSTLENATSSLNPPASVSSANVVFSILLLKDMSNFGAVNCAYASLFKSGEPNPPARMTIACPLPENIEVSLSVVLDLGPRKARRGLHVQSRSYWAPANIGPYSQAICVPLIGKRHDDINEHDLDLIEIVHLAGQIPLVPQTMSLSQADFLEQAVLSLQHLWRIGQERGVDLWPWGIAFLERCEDVLPRAAVACQIWQQAHLVGMRSKEVISEIEEDHGGPDAWDMQYNRASKFGAGSMQMTVGEHRHLLPNPAVFAQGIPSSDFIPPFLAAEVVSLPRKAQVEWWSLGITNLPKSPTSRPRLLLTQRDYGWGAITKVTIIPGSDADSHTLVHLITIEVHQAMTSEVSGTGVGSIEDDVLDLIQSGIDIEESMSSTPEFVHGTALISAQGQERSAQLHEQRLFKDLVVVPCVSLYASSSRQNSAHSATTTEPALCQPLTLAITMRIDNR